MHAHTDLTPGPTHPPTLPPSSLQGPVTHTLPDGQTITVEPQREGEALLQALLDPSRLGLEVRARGGRGGKGHSLVLLVAAVVVVVVLLLVAVGARQRCCNGVGWGATLVRWAGGACCSALQLRARPGGPSHEAGRQAGRLCTTC